MLRTRVITAVVLLAVLVAVLVSGSFLLFGAVAAIFFGVAAWESFRLFGIRYPLFGAAVWTAAFLLILMQRDSSNAAFLSGMCVLIWLLRLVPSLAIGLPAMESMSNRLLNGIYGVALLGCFVAIMVMVERSAVYLFSVMAIVWVADIGAYFAGKAFGKRKLAPSISPGKSWEGAIGGLLAVLALGSAAALTPALADTFPAILAQRLGWLALIGVLVVMVALSVVGDLFESQLKRRAGFKDSSNFLPGHGGVLDRIDALIPVLPLAVLVDRWM